MPVAAFLAPKPAPAPVALKDSTAQALAHAVVESGQTGGAAVSVFRDAVGQDGQYSAVRVEVTPGSDPTIAYFGRTDAGSRILSSSLGSDSSSASSVGLPKAVFDSLNALCERTCLGRDEGPWPHCPAFQDH